MLDPTAPDPLTANVPPPAADRMQRVRVGVTGLAAVVIVVALATAIASGVRPSTNANGTVSNGIAIANTTDVSSEPLAQLGVAPGGRPAVNTTAKRVPAR